MVPFRERLFGLTIQPERLREIREERRPGSRYAQLDNCRHEVREAEHLMQQHGIPMLDTTSKSIEEIATTILHRAKLERAYLLTARTESPARSRLRLSISGDSTSARSLANPFEQHDGGRRAAFSDSLPAAIGIVTRASASASKRVRKPLPSLPIAIACARAASRRRRHAASATTVATTRPPARAKRADPRLEVDVLDDAS